MRTTLFGKFDILRYLKKVRIAYSVHRPAASENARWAFGGRCLFVYTPQKCAALSRARYRISAFRDLILRLTSASVARKYPQLEISWEMLDADVPAFVEATLVDGRTHKWVGRQSRFAPLATNAFTEERPTHRGVRLRQLLRGFSSAQKREIVDKWRFAGELHGRRESAPSEKQHLRSEMRRCRLSMQRAWSHGPKSWHPSHLQVQRRKRTLKKSRTPAAREAVVVRWTLPRKQHAFFPARSRSEAIASSVRNSAAQERKVSSSRLRASGGHALLREGITPLEAALRQSVARPNCWRVFSNPCYLGSLC